jgi:hypothetical protein
MIQLQNNLKPITINYKMIPMISNDLHSITKWFQWFTMIYIQLEDSLKPITINYKMIPIISNDLHSITK